MSTLSPSRLDNDISFCPNWSHRDIRDPVSVTRPNRWPTWHWHWWELETIFFILYFVMIGCDLCSPVVINAGRPAVITLLQRVVNGKGQIQTLTKSTGNLIIDFGCNRKFCSPNTCPCMVWCSWGALIYCFFRQNPQSAKSRRRSSRYGDIQAEDKQRARDMRCWCLQVLIENWARLLLEWGTSRMRPIRGAVGKVLDALTEKNNWQDQSSVTLIEAPMKVSMTST